MDYENSCVYNQLSTLVGDMVFPHSRQRRILHSPSPGNSVRKTSLRVTKAGIKNSRNKNLIRNLKKKVALSEFISNSMLFTFIYILQTHVYGAGVE